MSNWKTYRLGELIEVLNGFAFKSKDFDYEGVPIIKINNVLVGGVDFTDAKYYSGELTSQLKKFLINKDDILISLTGSHITQAASVVGRIGKYPFDAPALLNQRVGKIYSLNEEILDNKFLYYYLNRKEIQFELASMAGGSANQANISGKQIKNLEIELPPVSEQKEIASILSSLDDKIRLNNQINQNLEGLAQSLFKHWFVDFEFPDENGDPYKSSGGKIVDSELGEIPEGWEIKSLDEIAHFLNGLPLQKYKAREDRDTLPAIKIRELRQGVSAETDKVTHDIPNKYIVENGDLLFSWSGTLMIDFWCNGSGALNQHLYKVTSEEYPKWFYYHWINHHLKEFRSIAESKVTTMGHIQRKHLKEAKIACPPHDFIIKMGDTIAPNIEKIINQRLQNKNMLELRNLILPKLMTGELTINQAEKEVV